MVRDINVQLAVLIGAPHPGDVSMHHDLDFMHDVVLGRGLPPEQILRLEGSLDRDLLLGFLSAVGQRVWRFGVERLLLYVTGHGFFAKELSGGYDVGLALNDENSLASGPVSWQAMFAALRLP